MDLKDLRVFITWTSYIPRFHFKNLSLSLDICQKPIIWISIRQEIIHLNDFDLMLFSVAETVIREFCEYNKIKMFLYCYEYFLL